MKCGRLESGEGCSYLGSQLLNIGVKTLEPLRVKGSTIGAVYSRVGSEPVTVPYGLSKVFWGLAMADNRHFPTINGINIRTKMSISIHVSWSSRIICFKREVNCKKCAQLGC